jgi:hypothetical protein
MEVGIEVEGAHAWLLGNDLTHDGDGAVRDSAPTPGPTRADGLRLPSEPDLGLNVVVVTEFSSEGAAS